VIISLLNLLNLLEVFKKLMKIHATLNSVWSIVTRRL